MSTLLSIKTDEATKQQVKDFAAELGITSTAFVNMVIKQALRNKRIVLTTDLTPTDYLTDVMKEAEADYKTGTDITRTKTKKETLNHLDSLIKNP